MGKGLNDCFIKTDRIAKNWIYKGWVKEKDKTIDQLADSIARRFRDILKKMDFKDEIKWYMSESSEKNQGNYIFGDEKSPELIKWIIDLFANERGILTVEEKETLKYNLIKMLPISRSVKEYKELQNNDALFEEMKWNDSPDHLERITELVENYYRNQELEAYEKKVFFRIKYGNTVPTRVRKIVYSFQYHEIKEWYKKWNFIMLNVGTIRIAERYDCSFWVFYDARVPKQVRENYYKTGKLDDEKINLQLNKKHWIDEQDLYDSMSQLYVSIQNKKDQKSENWKVEELIEDLDVRGENEETEKGCKIKCVNLVKKILSHKLHTISEKDFDYLREEAYTELAMIFKKVEHTLFIEVYREEICDASKDDLKKLVQIREMTEIIRKQKKQTELMNYIEENNL